MSYQPPTLPTNIVLNETVLGKQNTPVQPIVQRVFNGMLTPGAGKLSCAGTVSTKGGWLVRQGANKITVKWAPLVADTSGPMTAVCTPAADAVAPPWNSEAPTKLDSQGEPLPTTIIPIWNRATSSTYSTHSIGAICNNFNNYNTISCIPQLNSVELELAPGSADTWVMADQNLFRVKEVTSFRPMFQYPSEEGDQAWLPIRENAGLIYGQEWYNNTYNGLVNNGIWQQPTSSPTSLGDVTTINYSNSPLSHNISQVRSMYFIALDDPDSTEENPHVFLINNRSESAMNPSKTACGQQFWPTIGHYYFPVMIPNAEHVSPGFPIPVDMCTYNSRLAAVRNGVQAVTSTAPTSLYHTSAARSECSYCLSQDDNISIDASGILEEQVTRNYCGFPKNATPRWGEKELIVNNIQGWGAHGFPSGYAVNPQYTYNANYGFLWTRKTGTNSFTKMVTYETVIEIPPGWYNPETFAHAFNEAAQVARQNGSGFLRQVDLREEEVIFTCTDNSDDDVAYKGAEANTVYPFSTVGKKGRSHHYWSGCNNVQTVGSASFGLQLGPLGNLQFSGAFDLYAPQTLVTSTWQEGVPSAFRFLKPYHRGPWDRAVVGNCGQIMDPYSTSGGDQTTPDLQFLMQSVAIAPYYMLNANSINLEAVECLPVTDGGSSIDGVGRPSAKSQGTGRTYSNRIPWNPPPTMSNQYVPEFTSPAAPYQLPTNDIADSCAGFKYMKPNRPSVLFAPYGLQLMSIGDGSEGENALLTMLGFIPEDVGRIWTPEVQYCRPVEGVTACFNPPQYYFNREDLVISDQAPYLYSRWGQSFITTEGFYRGYSNPADFVQAFKTKNIGRCLQVGFGSDSAAGNPSSPNTFAGYTPYSTGDVTSPMVQARTNHPIVLNMVTAFAPVTVVPASLAPYIAPYSMAATALPGSSIPTNTFSADYNCTDITNSSIKLYGYPVMGCTLVANDAADWPEGSQVNLPYIVSHGYNRYNVHSAMYRSIAQDRYPIWDIQTDMDGNFINLHGIRYTVSDDDTQCATVSLPGTSMQNKIWSDNFPKSNIFIQRCGTSFCLLNKPYTPMVFADRFHTATCAVPTYEVPWQGTVDRSLIRRPETKSPQLWDVYIQGHTDLWGSPNLGGVGPLWRSQSWLYANADVTPESYPPEGSYVATSASWVQGPNGWRHMTPRELCAATAGRIPVQGRVCLDRLSLFYTNQQLMTNDAGFWGMATVPEIQRETVPSDNIYKKQLSRLGNEPEIFAIVTNFTPNMESCLGYEIGANSLMSSNNPSFSLQSSFNTPIVVPQPFNPNSNIDFSEALQIPNPTPKVLQAANPPGISNTVDQSGIMYLAIDGVSFSPRTAMYINGKYRCNLIPLSVNPSSNDELNLITFQSQQSWEYPSQYISGYVLTILNGNLEPYEGLTNFTLQMVLSETGSLPSSIQAYQNGAPVPPQQND